MGGWVRINRGMDMPARKEPPVGDTPWQEGDAGKKIGLNVPFPEPLMIKLDYLVANKVIFSKSSFIRDVVEEKADAEIRRLWKVREAIRQMDSKSKGRP